MYIFAKKSDLVYIHKKYTLHKISLGLVKIIGSCSDSYMVLTLVKLVLHYILVFRAI